MDERVLLLLLALLLAAAAWAHHASNATHAEMIDAHGQAVGNATLTQTGQGVRIELKLAHLPAGRHALHIHAVGKCVPPDFTSAGGHFNPLGKQHGLENPDGPHAGDLPNFDVGQNGRADFSTLATRVTLGGGPNSLFHPGGTSLVIHAGADDNISDPAGNAGARIACGVIRR